MAMRVAVGTVEPDPFIGLTPGVEPSGPSVLERSAPNARVWGRRAMLVVGHLSLALLLVPALFLLGVLVVLCTVAVLAPFVALPLLHAPFPWPALLTDGLALLGVQAPRAVPALFAALIWLGLSSAATLLLVGFRWTG